MKKIYFDSLIRWFLNNKRVFPWRENVNPYAVWISEIMLQQTRASVVVDYFIKWMNLFPDMHHLAKAHKDEVIKAWEGLGYYSRARNIHKAAKIIVEEYNGTLPNTREQLENLPGIGSYTAGAILSFAHQQKAAAVDGNVMRVLSRALGSEKDIAKPQTKKLFEEYLYKHLPNKQAHIVMEGLIELGALNCNKKARCISCPLVPQCEAFKQNKVEHLPIKTKVGSSIKKHRHVFCIMVGELILLKKNEKGTIMADLWEFPFSESDSEPHNIFSNVKLVYKQSLKQEMHSFTKYQVKLSPAMWIGNKREVIEEYNWIPLKEAIHLPFSSGHKKVLLQLTSELKI